MLKGVLRSQSDFHLKKIDEYLKVNYGIALKEIEDIFRERRNNIVSNRLFEGKCYLQKNLYTIKLIYVLKFLDKTNEFLIKTTEVNAADHEYKYVKYDSECVVPTEYILNLFARDDDGIDGTEEISAEKYDEIKKTIKKMYNSIYIPE